MRDIVKPGLVLFVTALIAALTLSLIREATRETIAQNEINKRIAAMSEVLPQADGTFGETVETGNEAGVISYQEGLAGGQTVGYVMSVSEIGYGGTISLLVGISADGTVADVRIIAHTETPGLGAKASDDSFLSQYTGKSGALRVVKQAPAANNEIQAITSATITTTAVTNGINKALAFYESELQTLQQGGAQ